VKAANHGLQRTAALPLRYARGFLAIVSACKGSEPAPPLPLKPNVGRLDVINHEIQRGNIDYFSNTSEATRPDGFH